MKQTISILLALLLLSACSATADTLTTNSGVTLDTAQLPYCTDSSDASVVYYISDISPESLVMMYDVLGIDLPGKVGVKMSTGESERSNYLRPVIAVTFRRRKRQDRDAQVFAQLLRVHGDALLTCHIHHVQIGRAHV